MTQDAWIEIDAEVASAARHLSGAVRLYESGPITMSDWDGYSRAMAFLHAMQSGHTSMESALRRVFAALGEDAPVGHEWHRQLIKRAAQAIPGRRPAIISESVAKALDRTRRFRHVAVHVYDDLDPDLAASAVPAAKDLAKQFPRAIADFRAAIGG